MPGTPADLRVAAEQPDQRAIAPLKDKAMATRGFRGRGRQAIAEGRLPPGQYLTQDFPVLSAGPTPRVDLSTWRFTLRVGPRPVRQWTWEAFNQLPMSSVTSDIHCVTQWSRFDTNWRGVLV